MHSFSADMETPGTQSNGFTVTVSDPALLRKMQRAARTEKTDFNNPAWLAYAVTKCCREHYGLDADLTIADVAGRLNCHRNTVKNYFHQGRFPNAYYRSNGIRAIRIPLVDVLALSERTLRVAA